MAVKVTLRNINLKVKPMVTKDKYYDSFRNQGYQVAKLMTIPLWQIDAFCSEPFSGNPAAVCILDKPREDSWLQAVAAEMNLSETAFLQKRSNDDANTYDLRWFTPVAEVDLCGHATLASAHTLGENHDFDSQTALRFHTKSGWLTATRQSQSIQLDFPADFVQPTIAPQGLAESLNAELRSVSEGKFDYLIELDSADTVCALEPDFQGLRALKKRGFIVTATSDSAEFDVVSRYFAPAVGIDEDPVTGSAHCTLGPFWSERLGKNELMAYQASKRGGKLKVSVENERVYLTGQAVTIFKGALYV
jgi:PhzF family phenazine biosynthesis protein